MTVHRLNVVDLAAGAGAVAVAALAVAGYALFRTPPTPRIDRVEPPTLHAARDMRVRVQGNGFLPFFRVFLERTGGPATLTSRLGRDESSDAFTLSNRAQARFVVESPTLAEVWIPEGTLPGTYTLGIYDETRRVAVKDNAFTVEPSGLGSDVQQATMRVFGSFRGLSKDAVTRFAPGLRFTVASGTIAEVLSVSAPIADTLRLQVGNTFVNGSVDNRLQVPAALRVYCTPFDGRCRAGDTYVAAFSELSLPFEGETARFVIHEVIADGPSTAAFAKVVARFEVPREIAGLMTAGDKELFSDAAALSSVPVVTLLAIHQRGATPSSIVLDGELLLPVVMTSDALFFRGEALKLGTPLSFTTQAYTARGSIVSLRGRDVMVAADK